MTPTDYLVAVFTTVTGMRGATTQPDGNPAIGSVFLTAEEFVDIKRKLEISDDREVFAQILRATLLVRCIPEGMRLVLGTSGGWKDDDIVLGPSWVMYGAASAE